MNYKAVVINALQLIFWESQLPDATVETNPIVKVALKDFNIPKNANDTETTQEIYLSLTNLATKLTLRKEPEINKAWFTQQIRLITQEEPYVGDIIIESINQVLPELEIRKQILSLARELKEINRKDNLLNFIRSLANDYVYGNKNFELSDLSNHVISHCETYAVNDGDSVENMAGVMDYVDFTDIESLERIFKTAKEEVSPDEIIKFGMQGLNRMFGENGGGRRGEQILIGGLQHHYKSGLAMKMTSSAAIYNTPKPKDPNKKPAILLVSTENDMTINVKTIYKQIFEPIVGRTIKMGDIDPSVAAREVKEKFAENGWHFLMVRVNPDEFGYNDYVNMVLQLETNGYELIVVTVDYLAMMQTKGLYDGGITGRDKQALFKRIRNFNCVHKILFITPHQLSTEALQIERDRPGRFLDEILNRAYYNECKTIAQEVDVEINIQKQIIEGKTYLNLGRGKHRGADNTPLKDQRCSYEFTEFGIPDDINGIDLSMPRPGAGSNSSGGGMAWFHSSDSFEFQQN